MLVIVLSSISQTLANNATIEVPCTNVIPYASIIIINSTSS